MGVGGRALRFGRKKTLALLCYLAAEGRKHPMRGSSQRPRSAPLVGSRSGREGETTTAHELGGRTTSTNATQHGTRITTEDGAQIFFEDWGEGRSVVFSHGWPLSADAREVQMVFLAQNGYRCVAHDRRGRGRLGQPSGGNEMDAYSDDLAALVEELDLHDAVLVGHPTGGGEVARYIGRHGTSRVAKAVLVGAIAPLMLKTEANPYGLPIEAFHDPRASLAADLSQFWRDLADGGRGATPRDPLRRMRFRGREGAGI